MTWLLRIEDPSGETRRIALEGACNGVLTLGRSADSDICLRDPTVPPHAAMLWPAPLANPEDLGSPYWVRVHDGTPNARLADLPVREASLPRDLPFSVGETKITLESDAEKAPLPVMPSGVRPWLTGTEEGRRVLWTVRKSANTPLSIYLGGETGTGKEVLANLIHAWSARAGGPFVPLHCGALPLALAESELFGHVKGAFTGAVVTRAGALMQAHGGTLFLDEIGDLPLDIQVKLLRFLEDGEIRPVGADRAARADVRVLCATHLPLRKLVEEGRFRRDLYYRLASITIEIPPLRSRPADIELLASRFAGDLGRVISPRARLRLLAHEWPGNVRELQHAIERAAGLAGPFAPMLDEESFEFLVTPQNVTAQPDLGLGGNVLTLKDMERVLILKALRLANGNRKAAAKILGIARSTLFVKLKKHRIIGPKGVL